MSSPHQELKRNEFLATLAKAERALRESKRAEGATALSPELWQKTKKDNLRKTIEELSIAALGNADPIAFFKSHLESQKALILEPETRDQILPAIAKALQSKREEAPTLLSGDNPLLSALKQEAAVKINIDTSHNELPHNEPPHIEPPLKILNAATAPLEVLREGEPDCISTAIAGAAESGTLFLTSGPENPTPLNFLSRCHIILINKENIVATYEEALQMIKADGSAPRTINMISGPSRTADIEQTLTLGAHGPVELIVVIH